MNQERHMDLCAYIIIITLPFPGHESFEPPKLAFLSTFRELCTGVDLL